MSPEGSRFSWFSPVPIVVLVVAVAGAAAAGYYYGDDRRLARLVEASRLHLENDEVRAAFIQLRSALDIDSEHDEANFLLAKTYVRVGNGARAAKLIAELEARGFEHPELDVLELQTMLLERDFAGAIRTIEGRADGRDDPEMLSLLGQAELARDRADDALRAFSRLLEVEPGSAEARRGMAKVAISKGRSEEAAAQIDKALAADEADVQTWALKGQLELDLGRYAMSAESFDRALALAPAHTGALRGAIQALLELGRVEAAGERAAALRASQAKDPVSHYLAARVARASGDLDAARDDLHRALQIAPDHAASLLLLAEIHLETGAMGRAEEIMRDFIKRAPDATAARKLLASVLIDSEQPEAALRALEPLEKTSPDDAALLALLGDAHRKLGNLTEARLYLTRAAALVPQKATLRRQLAAGMMESGDQGAAIRELQSVVDIAPDDFVTGAMLVLGHLSNGDRESALSAAQRLVKRHPDLAAAHNALGFVHEFSGRHDAAKASFRAALDIDSTYVPGALNLARLEYRGSDPVAAAELYDRILALEPRNVTALVGQARIASDAKRHAESLALLEKARGIDATALAPRMVLAGYHLRRGDLKEARVLVDEAAAIAPGSPRVMFIAARVHLAEGDIAAAVGELESVVRRYPGAIDAQLQLAAVYERRGDMAKARRALRRVLEIEPKQLNALAGLASLAMRARDGATARRMATELTDAHPAAAVSHVMMGDALAMLGDVAGALPSYDRALEIAPSPLILTKRHRTLAQAGRADESVDFLRDWLVRVGDDREARLLLAGALAGLGRAPEAVVEYERLLEDRPDDPVALNNLAPLYVGGSPARALDLARRAHALQPDSPAVADTLGWVLVQTGSPEEGLEFIDLALAALPNHPELRYHRAAGLARLGRTGEARGILDALLGSRAAFDSRDAATALRAGL